MSSKKILSDKDVRRVAKLSKLSLTDDEVKKFGSQLSHIVGYIDELREVDTKGVEPTSQTTRLTNIVRRDEADSDQTLSQDEALSGTENTHNGYFKVPIMLEERTV